MNHKIKKISVVSFGSFAVAIAVSLIASTLSYPLGITEETREVLFGEWAIFVRIIIAAIAFPILWRYLKLEKQ